MAKSKMVESKMAESKMAESKMAESKMAKTKMAKKYYQKRSFKFDINLNLSLKQQSNCLSLSWALAQPQLVAYCKVNNFNLYEEC